jgi:hypothetical protein
VRPDFVFRSGKYKGKTYSFVRRVDPRWLSWVEINRPEMLRETPQRTVEAPEAGEWVLGARKFEEPPDRGGRWTLGSGRFWEDSGD